MLVIISRVKKLLRKLKSLRFQSLMVLLFIGVLPLVLFSLILLNSYRSRAIDQQTTRIQTRGAVLCNLVTSSAFFTNDVSAEVDSELTQISDIYDGRIMVVDSRLKVLRDTYGLEEGKTLLIDEVPPVLNGRMATLTSVQGDHLLIVLPVYQADQSSIGGAVVMNFSLGEVVRMYQGIRTILFTMLLCLGVIVLIVAALYSGQVVRPVQEMTGQVKKISEGDFSEQMNIRGYEEVEKLSDEFNHMLSDLQNLEDARQEFVSNVSHELKTPITSMKVLSESLTGQEGLPVELYQEFMEDIGTELDRMNEIINDLLALVKMDRSAATQVTISEVNVNEFVEKILKQLQPIADKRNIDIIYESVRPVSAQIDEVKLSMAFRNLIENAIKYNYDDGWVRVSLNADHKFFYLKVSDSGEGIPEDLQDHIFERFYRVDKARARETGGSGLGLAITRSAVLLHHGSIKVHSVEQQGTTFNVRIPLRSEES
ncbi:MAG: HAMP domain-containing sensor histidine kinase [Eubacterium sp.]|nr:HAMP domain-containing sensor histidine kinase [Eubacterium sp.]